MNLALDRDRDRRGTVRVPDGIKRRKLGKIGRYTVWLVDGERVRNEVYTDFTCGGSDARYSFIERNCIWLDDVLGPLDATATLLHEYIEAALMKRRGYAYEKAHDIATARESEFRARLADEGCSKVSLATVRRALP